MSYEEIVHELVQSDDRFVVMTAENRAPIRNLPKLIGTKFIDTGITEQTMVGAAAGLALRGRIPIIHALSAFLIFRAYEFIRNDVSIPNLPVKLVGWIPGILSDANGPTHQAIEDVALMRGIPGIQIFCPADIDDLLIGIRQVFLTPSPCYIRYCTLPSVYHHAAEFEIGKAELVENGSDISIVTYGALFTQALEATQILRAKGISVRLVNLRMLNPVDEKVILAAAIETSLIVTVEDHFIAGGLFSMVAEILLAYDLQAPRVIPIGFKTWFKPARLPEVLKYEGLTGDCIAAQILKEMESLEIAETNIEVA